MRGHVVIITETESTYVMIKSTLRFDDVEDVPGLLLLQAVQRSRMRSRERSGRRPGNKARYYPELKVSGNTTHECNAYPYYITNSTAIDLLLTSQHKTNHAKWQESGKKPTSKNGKTSTLLSCPRQKQVTAYWENLAKFFNSVIWWFRT